MEVFLSKFRQINFEVSCALMPMKNTFIIYSNNKCLYLSSSMEQSTYVKLIVTQIVTRSFITMLTADRHWAI